MRDCEILCYLKELAALGAIDKFILIKTKDFGKIMSISQQTSSRKISELEKLGYVKKIITKNGTKVMLTENGINFIKKEIDSLKLIEQRFSLIIFKGKVTTGMGEGSYYMSRPGYVNQFIKIFNEKPYPGTFNVEIDEETMEKLNFIKNRSKYILSGFVDQGRTFGSVYVQKAKVNGINSYLIFPERSHYKNVIELVSSKNLRETLNVKDGDIVNIEVHPEII